MSETTSQQTTTPVRRKHSRQSTKSTAHKAYASENDVAVLETPRPHMPKTPNKTGETSTPDTDFPSSQHSNSKSRAKNKANSKNVPLSPDPTRYGRQTPPQRSVSIKPGINTAFAGATFHASPAPSALPIPSFLSKSSSGSPAAPGKGALQEPSPPPTDGDIPTPFRPSSVPKMSESPLDFMFRAHREEKERNFRENLPSHSSSTSQSPQHSQPSNIGGLPKPSSLPHQRRTCFRQQAGGIDFLELDGTPGKPLGPAFSTPYQERIKAARSVSNSNTPRSTGQTAGYLNESEPVEDPAEALKKFLFGSKPLISTGPLRTATETKFIQQTVASANPSMSTGTESGPKTVRADNIEEMENDLRRILKVDMTPGSDSGSRAFFSR
ncbi:uncharacterized protein MAM_04695 [Metarhizium album ARSEF 1941]|uniref:Proteophosphoglycan 5 n=1 Tax=Metarhizium album (strain ARSEF 1941) TaxID=1081103 RepID=A0A0B2WXU6_METAS|nr:uncharacterized protein MAM_04695 [Metarhizium album ARSEF 1941]KHN97680.1 hypothetical protein MAM_04695 [Metarhizium album ARSEF 1941]